ncbi:hypothetical protein EOK75_13615 (plasmid) [Pseudorhodobacter turbinis]|uniref:BioF2-like acetyltransferase domain-containing protein n=1 Tax=Pseudorhodobacter turbinis TaxID=2500533 RepID=A0A4V1E144_9RHOB|nr:hypothetical protein [Pseudorhodobacter turbinis]QCO56844.1 hypothetical protein EOK75_13615 [Pseudorhodobacter turbinis]
MKILWDSVDEAGWQARVAGMAYGLRQSWGYGQAMTAMGGKVGRALIVENGAELAMVQVMQRRGLRVIGQGPIWLGELSHVQKRRVLRRLARFAGMTVATPDEALTGLGMIPLITPQSHAIWKVGMSDIPLRAQLQGKWRNRLLKAEAEVQPRILGNDKALQKLVFEEARQRRARGYRNLPGEMALHWPGKKLVLGWHSGGALQAGMVFLIHGQVASYFLGWNSPKGRGAFAHGPLLWRAGQMLRDRGVASVNLGTIDTEGGATLARFKLGTGALVQVAGATRLVLP